MGMLVSIEGGDFTGKTTVAVPGLSAVLQAAGVTTRISREPGGTSSAEQIRHLLRDLGTADETVHPVVELALLNAARRLHLDNVIGPFLRENPASVFIVDRFVDSSAVYQTATTALDMQVILDMHSLCTAEYEGVVFPDITYILYIPESRFEAVIKDRLANRERVDRYDRDHLDAHLDRQRAYLSLPQLYRAHGISREFRIVDASLQASGVVGQIVGHQQAFFDERGISISLREAFARLRDEGHWAEQDVLWKPIDEMGHEGTLPPQARR
jgi:dTMP kinase